MLSNYCASFINTPKETNVFFSIHSHLLGPISIDDTQCATATCDLAAGKFAYSVGSMYKFMYEADTVTSLQGAAEEHSSLHVRAEAQVHVVSRCEFALTVSLQGGEMW